MNGVNSKFVDAIKNFIIIAKHVKVNDKLTESFVIEMDVRQSPVAWLYNLLTDIFFATRILVNVQLHVIA